MGRYLTLKLDEDRQGCAAIRVQLLKKIHLFLSQDRDIQDPYKAAPALRFIGCLEERGKDS